jgi:hypothetical protein
MRWVQCSIYGDDVEMYIGSGYGDALVPVVDEDGMMKVVKYALANLSPSLFSKLDDPFSVIASLAVTGT